MLLFLKKRKIKIKKLLNEKNNDKGKQNKQINKNSNNI